MSWEIETSDEFDRWFGSLSRERQKRLIAAIDALAAEGPGLGRPLVDSIRGSKHSNMKELRRGTIRVLFAFDPQRAAVLLIGGDKRGRWQEWYDEAITAADKLFDQHLRRLAKRDKGKRDGKDVRRNRRRDQA